MKRKIALPCFGIVVTLAGEIDKQRPDALPQIPKAGSGTITSNLHRLLPAGVEGGSEVDTAHDRYEAAVDAIEAMILAHATAGVDITAPAYVEGIESVVNAL